MRAEGRPELSPERLLHVARQPGATHSPPPGAAPVGGGFGRQVIAGWRVGGQAAPCRGAGVDRGKSAASMGRFVRVASLAGWRGLGVRTDRSCWPSRTALGSPGGPTVSGRWPPGDWGSRPGGRGRTNPAPTQAHPRGAPGMGDGPWRSFSGDQRQAVRRLGASLAWSQRQWPGELCLSMKLGAAWVALAPARGSGRWWAIGSQRLPPCPGPRDLASPRWRRGTRFAQDTADLVILGDRLKRGSRPRPGPRHDGKVATRTGLGVRLQPGDAAPRRRGLLLPRFASLLFASCRPADGHAVSITVVLQRLSCMVAADALPAGAGFSWLLEGTTAVASRPSSSSFASGACQWAAPAGRRHVDQP